VTSDARVGRSTAIFSASCVSFQAPLEAEDNRLAAYQRDWQKSWMSSQFLSSEFLYRQNEFIVTLAAFVLFLVAMEIGFRHGRAIGTAIAEAAKSQVSTLQAGVMGLLALLIAFTFAMADSRFAIQQRLVVEEANAIRTVSLGSQLLPEPYHSKIAALLRDYVDTRLAYHIRIGGQKAPLHQCVCALKPQNYFRFRARLRPSCRKSRKLLLRNNPLARRRLFKFFMRGTIPGDISRCSSSAESRNI
jgi:hypothetical protein